MNPEIVPVKTEAETRVLAELASVIWHECFVGNLTPEQIDYMVEQFQSFPAMTQQMAHEGYEYYLAYVNGKPTGYLGILEEEDGLKISKLYLLPQARGTGLADKLFDLAYRRAWEKGLAKVWLTVNRYNDRAVAAYKKRGFTLLREQVMDIGDGFVMDDFVMGKQLEA